MEKQGFWMTSGLGLVQAVPLSGRMAPMASATLCSLGLTTCPSQGGRWSLSMADTAPGFHITVPRLVPSSGPDSSFLLPQAWEAAFVCQVTESLVNTWETQINFQTSTFTSSALGIPGA